MVPNDPERPTDGPRGADGPGRRNRLAADDARAQRILMTVLRSIFVVVLIWWSC